MDLGIFMQREITRLNRLKHHYTDLPAALPAGRLSFVDKKGVRYYRWFHDGTEENISKKADLLCGIQKRRYAEKMLKVIDNNLKVLEKAAGNIMRIDPGEILASLPAAYRNKQILSMEDGPFADIEAWENTDYERYTGHPEHLIHMTARGEYVRSKGEAIIANMLFDRGIPYRYEELVRVNGRLLAPDFTVAVRSENRTRYWEHCGMIVNPDYFNRYCNKQFDYITSGLMINRDVIFTYEDDRGSIDTRSIAETIEIYFR